MEKAAYYEIATYLKHVDRAVSPHELSVILGKSRVTIQGSLKRLLKNGWVVKEGSSPHTLYRGVEIDAMPKNVQKGEITIEELRDICKIGLIEDFVLKSNKIRYSKNMKPLICFDLDGTLTTESSWKLLNQRLGITLEDDARLFNEYLANGARYVDWIAELVNLHKATNIPVTKSDIVDLAQSIPLAPGAQEIITTAKEKGYDLLLLSGSVDTIVETMATRLGIQDWRSASSIVYNENGVVTDLATSGDERGAKLALLKQYCEERGYALNEVIAVEDGGNGLAVFEKTKGILVGNNKDLAPVAWKQVQTLPEIAELI